MKTRGITTGVMLAMCLALAGQATAGILATDVNAIPGWQGMRTFDTVHMFGATYYAADVEYAVYNLRNSP